ncbi:hypothetical protein LP420_24850 [Massilia sp. B-10]|nr:hypothetical protein LP420_24850 [Massilia sp. B-10]
MTAMRVGLGTTMIEPALTGGLLDGIGVYTDALMRHLDGIAAARDAVFLPAPARRGRRDQRRPPAAAIVRERHPDRPAHAGREPGAHAYRYFPRHRLPHRAHGLPGRGHAARRAADQVSRMVQRACAAPRTGCSARPPTRPTM